MIRINTRFEFPQVLFNLHIAISDHLASPNDNIYDAMQLFNLEWIEEIPVVESKEDLWILGMLRRRDVIAAYNHEVLKRGISEKEETFRVLCSTS